MAEPLKHFFDERVVRAIARDLHAVYPRFDTRGFVGEALASLDRLGLMARGAHLAEAMRRHLPPEFPDAARVILASLAAEPPRPPGQAMEPFRYLPHVLFVATHGLDHFEDSMSLQYELTKRFTAEFSIRPFLVRHPEATYERLRTWARDPNVHVRRLVSEGTRPRLPWAPRLRAFQEDPAPVLALLEMLRDDPERYVQRSVANNLNDIAKDHPTIVTEVCRRWLDDAPDSRRFIVQHALRSLVKKGDASALDLLGYGAKPCLRIEDVRIAPANVQLGREVRFEVELVSLAETELLVDYAVHFVKANGATRPKVFKLKKVTASRGERIVLAAKVSFAAMTTRKPHPGRHRLDLLVNGVAFPLGAFEVVT